jgi:hypothetical protein
LYLPEFRIYIKTLGTLTTNHRGVITSWKGISMQEKETFRQSQQLNRNIVTAFSLKVIYELL